MQSESMSPDDRLIERLANSLWGFRLPNAVLKCTVHVLEKCARPWTHDLREETASSHVFVLICSYQH